VLVENADRLARDLFVSEAILLEFRKVGVKVVTTSGFDLGDDDDPAKVLVRQMFGSIAQFNKSLLVMRLRAGRVRKRQTAGRCEGRKPFGARPGEAAIVDRIRALRRKPKGRARLSIAAIAEQLNREGVPTRGGGPWQPSTVHNVLSA
jgi:DNA invertase Pin-like site-specific DNA recombinase